MHHYTKSCLVKSVVILCLCALSIGSVQAASVFVANHGFEDDAVLPGTFPVGGGLPSSWSLYDPDGIQGGGNAIGVLHPPVVAPGETDPALLGAAFFPDGAPEGTNVALIFLSNAGTVGTPMGIEQTLAATLQANTRYTLTVEVGDIASGTGLPPADVFGFFNLEGFPGYRIELLAGDTVIGSDDNSLAGVLDDGLFATSSFSVDIGAIHANVGEALTIRLINLNQAGTPAEPGIEVDFDNVRLDASPVPLPPAVVLFVAALAPLLRRRTYNRF